MRGDILSGRSVTKTHVAMVEGGRFCPACGKPAPADATKRWKYCNDTCRQAAYRTKTGKSAYAGIVKIKTPVPFRAGKGLPKEREDWYREIPILETAIGNHCVGGVVEVYHAKYGRGVLDLFRPLNDRVQGNPYPVGNGSPITINKAVWKRPRCLFSKPKLWRYLDWQFVYLLKWHPHGCGCPLPKNLRWIHADSNRRIRKTRTIHLDFRNVLLSFDENRQTYVLTKEPAANIQRDTLIELTGGNTQHDEKEPKQINLDRFDNPDPDGRKSPNGRKRQ
jgi:hypothetical protein